MLEIRHFSSAVTDTRSLTTGKDVSPHHHDDPQLIYASSGVLEVMTPEGAWFTPPTQAAWIPSNTVHFWKVHGATTVHLVGCPLSIGIPQELSTYKRLQLVPVTSLLRELIIEYSRPEIHGQDVGVQLLQLILAYTRPTALPVTMLPALEDSRLREIEQLYLQNPSLELSLQDLGRRVGASERTLSRLFSEKVGMGFTAWRTQIRLHHALLMLAEGRNVTQTANICGFSTPSTFISIFKAYFGKTPGSIYQVKN